MATQTRIASGLRAFALVLALAGGAPPALADGAAPPLLLAEELRGDVALDDYWVSEKLDGARALWDGQSLRFRSGRTVPAPAWFVAALPPEPLDGELWLGRGRFAELSGIVRRQQPRDDEWRQVRFMVFEQPDGAGSFTERVERLKAIVARAGVPWLHVVEQFRVADRAALQARLDAVVAAGGEGLMLHRADAPYLTGRSDALLKLKPRLDAEATVVAHLPGRGRLAGMMGALLVETAAGVRFQLGTGFTDAERRAPPPVGAQVTFVYRELTRDGVPRFASYWRRREAF
ncbi:MAG: DNA ligase [Zoogloea sp.]|nr:DNA ligase [Zoogloea sp.]